MLSLCIWAVFLLSCAAGSYESSESTESSESQMEFENGYIFSCPRAFKTGASNELHLVRYGGLPAGDLEVTISYNISSNESTSIEKHFTFYEGERDSYLSFFIPQIDGYPFNGKIVICGTFDDGYTIGGSDKIYLSASKDIIVLIQTDKPIYKEGQTVQFRVLCVDKYLKPRQNIKVDIYVEDPKGTRLFQWKAEKLEGGMKQFDFQLADEPALGSWKIVCITQNDTSSTNFDVKEYVLPTFEVIMEKPHYVLVTDERIPIRICANYTYGKPVMGKLHLNVSLERYTWSNEKIPVIEHESEIDGCLNYVINVSMVDINNNRYRRIQVVAIVTEEGTDVERNATLFIERQFTPLFLSFNTEQSQYFKPGLPYIGKLTVNYPDNTPAKCEDIKICYTLSRERVLSNWWATKKLKDCSIFSSDEEGCIEYIIPPQSTDSVGITIDAIALKYAKKDKGTPQENSLDQPQTSMTLRPWYSSSGSFIQLLPVQETLNCGTQKYFKLLFTSKGNADFKFYYQVLKQGIVVKSGVIRERFWTENDVSGEYQDESKLVNGNEMQLVPQEDCLRPEHNCPAASEDDCYVPPIGEIKIRLDIDSSWSPFFHLLVYYMKDDREIIADSQKFKVEYCFKNQVKLQFADAVKQPATETSLRVSASPNSLCGIKVVDKSVSLINDGDQLTPEKIFLILESFDTGMYYSMDHCSDDIHQPGLNSKRSSGIIRPYPRRSSPYEDSMSAYENAGCLVISDLTFFTRPCKMNEDRNIKFDSGFAGGKGIAMASMGRNSIPEATTQSAVEVRNYFPETWLFELKMTSVDGEYVSKEKLPHTITEWVGSAVCINVEDGLGISNKTSIRGFQAFFVSLTLPYSIIRGEEFVITISICSYVDDALPITVYLDKMDGFKITGKPIDGDICVYPGCTYLKLKLVAKALGQQTLIVRAETAESSDCCGSDKVSDAFARDAIQGSIFVVAEGWKVEKIKSCLFCPKFEESLTKLFYFPLPDEYVADTPSGSIECTGNIMGKSIENLNNLVILPTGCGEQNMAKFATTCSTLELLINTDQLTDNLKSRTHRYLIVGYQNQLKYKHPDGSFSAFGTSDRVGSTFLTCFTLRSFSRAEKYIYIDKSIIDSMQKWLVSKQQMDGCFPNLGKIFDMELEGSLDKEKGLGAITAYCLTSLLISGYKNESVVKNALSCIAASKGDTLYEKSLSAYAYAWSGDPDSAWDRISALKEKSTTKDGTEYFHDINATLSQDIVTTSYVMLTCMKLGSGANDVLPNLLFLVTNMNPRGGFYSTQDTCVGLDAITQFASLTSQDPVDMRLDISGGGLQRDLTINEENKMLVNRFRIPQVPSEVYVTGFGTGCVLIQYILRYNTLTPPEKRNFNFEVSGQCLDFECKKACMNIMASYIPQDKSSNMALMEIKMISGYVVDKGTLEKLKNDPNVQLMRYEVDNDNVLVCYFKEMTNKMTRFKFNVEKEFDVSNAQPGTAKVYDYYNEDRCSSTTYTFKSCDSSSCSGEL